MKILFVTDCHFGEDSNYAWHGGEQYINVFGSQFSSYLERLKTTIIDGQYDLVVNLGDCIADHSYLHGLSERSVDIDRENFQAFLQLWENIATPVVHVLGNHDGELLSREEFKRMLHRNTYFSFDANGFHHIVLDPVWGKVPYYIDLEQLSWLKSDLKTTQLPTLVYIHTPCDEQDLSDNYYHYINPARYFVADRRELRGLFEDSGKVKLVVQGHSHFYANNNINGIKYLTLPSFLENDTTGKPAGDYVDLTINPESVNISMNNTSTPYTQPAAMMIRRKKLFSFEEPTNSTIKQAMRFESYQTASDTIAGI